MTKHLPECERWYAKTHEPDECPACEMFRACEQRVRDEHSEIDAFGGWVKGYAAGLDAAREAVLAVVLKYNIASDAPVVLEFLAGVDALSENTDDRRVSENHND